MTKEKSYRIPLLASLGNFRITCPVGVTCLEGVKADGMRVSIADRTDTMDALRKSCTNPNGCACYCRGDIT